jgi:impB/mucB/samB family
MRIACIHLPAFPLQVHARGQLARAGAAIAMVRGTSPVVVACSRAARAAGIRTGMTALTARELAPEIELVSADGAAERATVKAVAEALLGLSPRVDAGGAPVGGRHAMWAAVPPRMRGATFGARIRDLLEVMGLTARIGIADDRFAAHVAASWPSADGDHDGVVTVPRGGSAAFLAPMPLSLLAVGGEVQHMLELLGVHTLGEFAALPPPSVARPWGADYQSLARGDGGAELVAFTPGGPIVERMAVGEGGGLGAAVATIAARVAARLRGREAAAAAIELVLGDAGAVDVVPDAPVADAEELARALGAMVGDAAPPWIEARVRLLAGDGAVAAAVVAEESVPLPAAPQPSFRLVPPGRSGEGPVVPRAPHRRTRRGKERPRAVVRAQASLFTGS